MPTDLNTTQITLPRKLGKYTLRRVLGAGATSTVYLADDPFQEREVAVKLINKRRIDADAAEMADAAMRTEKALLGKLNYPHVIKIHDVVEDGDEHYVIMEYVGGGTMEQHCTRGRLLDPETVIDAIFKCGKALEYINGLGLIHRDLKPANILITDTADVKLTDFGATLISAEGGTASASVGTPFYMSPEQLMGNSIDFRSDMYSLGVVLYELLTGERPFQGSSMESITHQVQNVTPKPPSQMRPQLPPALDAVVARMMARTAGERYETWEACLEALMHTLPDLANAAVREPTDLSSMGERFRLLRQSPFFRLFSDADLWYVLEIATLNRIYEGDVLIREGDVGEFFLVLLEGKVRISKMGRLIDLVSPGMSMGEISYVLEGRVARNTTCVAMTDGIVMRVEDSDLRLASAICRSRFEKTFLKALAGWLTEANQRLSTMP
jgi:serine/threonine protein kinase